MNKILKQISSLVLAAVVLLSTLSFSVSKHYCLNRLIEISFINDVDGCMSDNLADENCDSFSAASCCDDVHIVVEGLDNFHFEKYFQLDFDIDYYFDTTFYTPEILIFTSQSEILYYSYKPPPLCKPIYQFNETYLI